MNDKKYWVWLSMIFGFGSQRLWQIMNICESAEEAYHEVCSGRKTFNLRETEKNNIEEYSLESAENFISDCIGKGIGIVVYSENEYPRQLKYIIDPPAVLFYKGDIGCVSGTKTVTSVGTRKAGSYGLSVTSKICSELAENGFVIVSGFAVGIDITSHLAAISANKPTACVLGCGVDVNYPKENFKYRDQIIDAGGVFISEYPPGTPSRPGNFPKRNRILSALGRVVIVFEAAAGSGSLITAELASEQGREIFVLPPGNVFQSCYSGNIKLMKEGAVPLTCAGDIIEFFKKGSSVAAEIRADAFASILDANTAARRAAPKISHLHELELMFADKNKKNFKSSEKPVSSSAFEIKVKQAAPEITAEPDLPEGTQRNIFALLKKEGRLHADVICMKLDISAAELATEITELEILGAVRACPGRMYEIR